MAAKEAFTQESDMSEKKKTKVTIPSQVTTRRKALMGGNVKTLTKRELALSVAETAGIPVDTATTAVYHALDKIIEALSAGRPVEFREFGVFEVVTRNARIGRNPKRPEEDVVIPERKVVKFKPGKVMREAVGNLIARG